MTGDTNSAATLSLEISTNGAHEKLTALETRMTGLGTKLESLLHAGGVASAGGLDQLAKKMQASVDQQVKAATAGISSQLASQQRLIDGFNAKSLAAGNAVRTSLASGSASLANSLKLDEGQLTRFYGRMKAAGLESVKALEEGITKANFTKSNQVIEAFRKNTEASLQSVLRMSRDAQRTLGGFGTQTAQDTYGKFLASGQAEKLARDALVRLGVERQITEQNKTQAAVQKLNDSGAATAALQANLALKKAELDLDKQRAAVQKLNDSGAATAALQANLAIHRQTTKELREQAQWATLTEKQQAATTLRAARALYAAPTVADGLRNQSLLPGLAGSGPALAAAQAVGGIKEAERAFSSLGPAVGKSAADLKHWSKVSNDAHAAARGLAGAVGGLWLTYGNLAPLLAGAALAGGFKAAAKAGAEFAYELTFVKALGGESAEAIDKISASTLAMSKNSLFGPVEMAQGLRVLAQAGLDANDAILALPTTLDLATVGEMGMAEAAITLTGVMNAFSLQVTDMRHIGDVFAKAAAVSQTSVAAMTQSMRMASVVGEQYGATMEDTATALTLLAKVNITGTAAGTSLRNMLKELYTPGDGAARVLKQLGVSASDASGNLKPFHEIVFSLKDELVRFDKASQANILQKIFGERGAKQAIALLSQTREEWDKLKDSIENSDGFITQVAAELEQTTQGRFKQALNTMKTNMVKAFNESEGGVRDLADSLKDLADSKEFQVVINGIVGSVAAMAKVLVVATPYLIDFGAAFLAYKLIGVFGASLTAAGAAIGGLSEALKIVRTTMVSTIGVTAGLRAGLLATSSAAGVAAGATGLGGLATAAAALFSPVGWIVMGAAAFGALAYALSRMTDGSNEATRSAHKLADAMTRQTDKMRDELTLLRERNRLRREGKDPDGAAESLVNRERAALESKLKFAKDDLAEAQNKSGGTIFDTVAILAARDTVTQLQGALKIVNERIVAGAELQTGQVQEELSSTIERMRDEADRLDRLALRDKRPADSTFRDQIEHLAKNAPSITEPQHAKALRGTLEALRDEAQSAALGAGNEKFVASPLDSASRIFKKQTDEIQKGYAQRVKAAETEFKNYKDILDQRVKYGAIAQGVENTLLEQAQRSTDAKTSALRQAEKQALQNLLVSKEVSESDKLSVTTRIEEIDAIQKSSEAARAHTLVLNQEKDALKQLAQARKLDTDIASFAAGEQLSRDRAVAQDYLKRNSSGERIAGVEAYYATIERGQAKLKEYEAAVRAAEDAQAALSTQIKSGSAANDAQYGALQKLGYAQGSSLAKYDTLFTQAAVQYSVDAALLRAVTYVESRGNPKAVSSQGAKGLMQLMPATARSLGVQDSFDPQQNISGGAKLLKENLAATGGDVDNALRMYHGGTNRSQWGAKTQEYVTLVKKAYAELAEATRGQVKVNDGLVKSIDQVDASHLASSESVKNAGRVVGEYADTLNSQSGAVAESITGQEDQAAAFAEAANAVDVARDAHDKYAASVEAQAQANAQLAESLKEPEEAIRRMAEALSAASAVMDATLNARKDSGFYTDLEGLRAEGNINKEKIAQLAELKAAYEAMGNAGAAAAKQVEAQMIELSAHLDPVADKIRGIFESAFEQFFNDVTDGVKSVKEAFRDLGKSILKSFAEIIAKNASQELMKILGGGLKPGESQGLFSILGNLLSPNGAGSAGSDIAATGHSIFGSLKSLGSGGGLGSTLQSLPNSASVGGSSALLRSTEGLSETFSSLGAAANDSIASFSNLGDVVGISAGSFTTLGSGLQTFQTAAATTSAGLTTLGVTTATTEGAVAASAVSSTLADVSLASTAVSAQAAAAGLSSVATTSSTGAASSGIGALTGLFAANGAAFDATGIAPFASGGTFTNQIVSTPTPFRFASGGSFKNGVMGEAGPEAVMPIMQSELGRDSKGRLGIKRQTGDTYNLKVVVMGNQSAPDVRRSAGQGAREALAAFKGVQRFG